MRKRSTMLIRIAVALLASLFVLSLFACANPESTISLSSQEVIEKCQTALKDVRSFRYEAISESSDNNQTLRSEVFAEYLVPDRSHLITTDESGKTEEINIAETRYTKLPESTVWTTRRFTVPFTTQTNISLDWNGYFNDMIITELSNETVDEADCYHYKGILDSKAAAEKARANIEKLDQTIPGYDSLKESQEMIAKSLEGMVSETEFWIGKADFILRKVDFRQEFKMKENKESKTEANYTMSGTYRYFDFNSDISIEPPLMVEEGR